MGQAAAGRCNRRRYHAAPAAAVLAVCAPGGIARAQPGPCDAAAQERSLEGEVGYRVRVDAETARRNQERHEPLDDPYCEGVFRSSVAGDARLSLSVQAAYHYSRAADPDAEPVWTLAWPFVTDEEVPGLSGPTRILGRSLQEGANYQLDGEELTPDACDHTCPGDPGVAFESFKWRSDVLRDASRYQVDWGDVGVVVSRQFDVGGQKQQLVLPVVLNPRALRNEIDSPARAGGPVMKLSESRLMVRVNSTVPIAVFAACVYPLGQPGLAEDIPPEARPSTLNRGQLEPFILSVDGWEGGVVQFDVGTERGDQRQIDSFYFYVPAVGFHEAVVRHEP